MRRVLFWITQVLAQRRRATWMVLMGGGDSSAARVPALT
jgi:hypothetical protein